MPGPPVPQPTFTVVLFLTPFCIFSVNDLSNYASGRCPPRTRSLSTCCSTRIASWGGMSP